MSTGCGASFAIDGRFGRRRPSGCCRRDAQGKLANRLVAAFPLDLPCYYSSMNGLSFADKPHAQ
jgi:hypothetical protein